MILVKHFCFSTTFTLFRENKADLKNSHPNESMNKIRNEQIGVGEEEQMDILLIHLQYDFRYKNH
jgi:hypothetical protein